MHKQWQSQTDWQKNIKFKQHQKYNSATDKTQYQSPVIPMQALGFRYHMPMSAGIEFDLILNHFQTNILASFMIFLTIIPSFWKALFFLCFQVLQMHATQITINFLDGLLPPPIKFSNCSMCCQPTMWRAELTPIRLQIEFHTLAKTRHTKKIWETDSLPPYFPIHPN